MYNKFSLSTPCTNTKRRDTLSNDNDNGNCTILWIPTLMFSGKEPNSLALTRAFEEQDLLFKQYFYPTEISPQGFPSGRDIIVDVDKSFGFSFKSLWFNESEAHKGVYNVKRNVLTVPLKLRNAETYSPTELAKYFREHWISHSVVG